MFGFGVGFGVSGFGSGGYALEVDASTAPMVGGTDFTARATVTTGHLPVVRILAVSSLALDPAGVTVATASPAIAAAKPARTPTLRTVPAPIVTTTYTIDPRRKR